MEVVFVKEKDNLVITRLFKIFYWFLKYCFFSCDYKNTLNLKIIKKYINVIMPTSFWIKTRKKI